MILSNRYLEIECTSYTRNMNSFKQSWGKLPSSLRKSLVLIIGSSVVIGGIILLPLPGPGWVIIFAGFALLATEFAFAERVQNWLVQLFKIGAFYLRKVWNNVRGKPTTASPPKFTIQHPSRHDTKR